jgi:Flp pilus assembly pilin Flp
VVVSMLAKFLLCNLGAAAIEYGITAPLIGMAAIGAERQSYMHLADALTWF